MQSAQTRLHPLNERAPADGAYVLYWMDRAQRAHLNHALDRAVEEANNLGLPVLAIARIGGEEPPLTQRQAKFVAEGLADVRKALKERDIGFLCLPASDEAGFQALLDRAAVAVADFGYLRHHRARRAWLGEHAPGRAVAVETDALVPVEQVGDRAEYDADAIRPKIAEQLGLFVKNETARTPVKAMREPKLPKGIDCADWAALAKPAGATGAKPVDWIRGGRTAALSRLQHFIARGLEAGETIVADPREDAVAYVSAYLRFGQISPIEVALKAREAAGEAGAFIEELLVRRELAANWCHFGNDYDRFDALPDWAKATLGAHAGDPRTPCYTAEALEAAETEDEVWNAAMRRMQATGFLPGALRIYWAKRILAWAPDPEHALATALDLNNRTLLDGGDHTAFAQVLSAFGLHDRPFPETRVFGTVRPMTRRGLERRIDVGRFLAAA
jgi:deoxyribodipyrimidine photo-lyase